jgi:hypothetical protein
MNRTVGATIEKARYMVDDRSTGRADSEGSRTLPQCGSQGELRSITTLSVQAKLEDNAVGRALINFGLIVTLAAILTASMPASVTRSTLLVWAQPYLTAIGLGEDWGVFAPSLRTSVIYGTAHIHYTDGTSSEWSFPTRPGLMAYSDYRWQKFEEYVRLDGYRGLWQPFAQYLARHESAPRHTPEQVALSRRWAAIQPPGVKPGLGPWAQHVYYTMPVGTPR